MIRRRFVLAVIAAAIGALVPALMASGALDRAVLCGPCIGGSIDEPHQYIHPGGTTRATVNVGGDGERATVTLYLDPLMRLLRAGSSPYQIVGGRPVFSLGAIHTPSGATNPFPKSIHFVAQIRTTAPVPKRLKYVARLSAATGSKSVHIDAVMFLHTCPHRFVPPLSSSKAPCF